jgi:enoyl-CoA hydratase/carnithine racemase
VTADPARSTGEVRATVLESGAVLALVLDRPRGNVLTMEMMGRLGAALDAHARDPHLKLVVLRGAGGTFSFGASVEEHR